jgi:hypothetical protein
MHILWLYRYIEAYDFDNWLHMKFAESLAKTPGVRVMCYGPEIHRGYPHMTTLPYDSRITLEDIRKHFPFDAVIMNTKSRMFMHYDPHRGQAEGCWVPEGTSQAGVPKIVIEEDYHYETTDAWYLENGVDLILQRHHSQSLRQEQVPMRWLPFSVDVNVFKPGPGDHARILKVGFAGSSNGNAYRMRESACRELNKHNLVCVFSGKSRMIGRNYVKCLQHYIAHISCSSIFNLSTAKMFEIMSSGAVLMTNQNDDLPLLFPEGSHCVYRRDGMDVVDVAKSIINDRPNAMRIARRGREAILARHSHEIRIKELLGIIQELK